MLELNFSADLLEQHSRQDLAAEFAGLDPLVRTAFSGVGALAWALFHKALIVTSMFRPTGHHLSRRMLDFDVDEKRAYYGLAPEEAQVLSDVVALTFVYDLKRPNWPVAVYGKNDSAGKHWDHIHLQVCYDNKTKFRHVEMSERWNLNIAVFTSDP